jgi:arginine-tRNA-protein transferase
LNNGLSAVYSFFDHDSKACFGSCNVLWQFYQAQTLNLSHLYLGHWIQQSQKMNYKTNFKPLELLEDGVWKALPSVKT